MFFLLSSLIFGVTIETVRQLRVSPSCHIQPTVTGLLVAVFDFLPPADFQLQGLLENQDNLEILAAGLPGRFTNIIYEGLVTGQTITDLMRLVDRGGKLFLPESTQIDSFPEEWKRRCERLTECTKFESYCGKGNFLVISQQGEESAAAAHYQPVTYIPRGGRTV